MITACKEKIQIIQISAGFSHLCSIKDRRRPLLCTETHYVWTHHYMYHHYLPLLSVHGDIQPLRIVSYRSFFFFYIRIFCLIFFFRHRHVCSLLLTSLISRFAKCKYHPYQNPLIILLFFNLPG